MKSRKKSKTTLPIVIVVIVVLLLVGFNYWLYRVGQEEETPAPAQPGAQKQQQVAFAPTNTPTPTPTPTKIGSGRKVLSISGGAQNEPKLTQAVIDPLDPAKGQKQSVEISASHTAPIDRVTVKLITDNKSQTYPLKLESGITQNGVWTGSWTMDDTYLYTYIFEITAASGSDQAVAPIVVRKKP